MAFTHLHVHTVFSLLDGASKIPELIKRAKELGQTSIAITDHGNMYGAIEFYKTAKSEGIKPIIGCEVYVSPRRRYDRESQFDRENRHLILLCKNETGYKNLMKLNSIAWTEGFYSKPRIDHESLKKYHDGLIAMSACLAGEISRSLMNGNYDEAVRTAKWYKSVFGEDYYLEIQDHGITEQKQINPQIIRLSKELDIPLAATNDCHYITKEDSRIQNILLCIQTNHTINEKNPMAFPTMEFYLKSEQEMRSLFSDIPQAIENTALIAEKCNLEIEFGKIKLPRFDLPDDSEDNLSYFKKLCDKGLRKYYGDNPSKEITDRLEYETDVISQMGYIDYFLIVADYVNYAKAHEIPVGAGRGSGAGSLAAYCIGITEIDPIRYDLLFERFLNPERVSMPDFDIDFCTERRQEVIDYVIRRYGSDHVAQIISFGTMAARASIRDVGRALDIPYAVCDKAAKLVPKELNITLKKALETSDDFRKLYETDRTIRDLIDTAMKLEGMPRNTTTHAAGVVITDKPVNEYVPLARNDDTVVTQYTMTELDELGLLKMDFLGLRNLTVLNYAQNMIRKTDPEFDIRKIPDDDKAVFEMYSRADTEGVFQFESKGMKNVLSRLKPESIEDIIAVISLYRPGPMDSIPKYIENRHSPDKIEYKHPLLKPILDVTYGCIVYQEQVMQIFRTLAGYSLGRADIVRRAMAKKKKKVMDEEKHIFIHGLTDENGNVLVDGCIRRGIDEQTALGIFSEMESFASYAFNRAHAAAYAYISYQTAYVKYHYPREYLCALMSSVLGDSGKIAVYLDECSKHGIIVLPPSVNESEAGFTVNNQSIRFGLKAIKNIGHGLIDSIIRNRKEGKYTSFYDFCSRVYGRDLNKRALENLIKSGSLDGLGANRRQMLTVSDKYMELIAGEKQSTLEGQMNFFTSVTGMDSVTPDLPTVAEFNTRELLEMEREITGIYFSGHPMSQYDDISQALGSASLNDLLNDENESYPDGKKIDVLCMITKIRSKITKNNSRMAFVNIEDKYGTVEMIVFPRQFAEYGGMITEGTIIRVVGAVSRKDDEPCKIICDKVLPVPKSITEIDNRKVTGTKKTPRGLYLRLRNDSCNEYLRAMQIIDIFDGPEHLFIKFTDSGKIVKDPGSMRVDPNPIMIKELCRRIGSENVVFVY